MKEKRTSHYYYERRLNILEDFLRNVRDNLKGFDEDTESDGPAFYPEVSYFQAIRKFMSEEIFAEEHAVKEVCDLLEKYIPEMSDDLQHRGDELVALELYKSWLSFIGDQKISADHLARVIKLHGGNFIDDTQKRFQYSISATAYVQSIASLCKVQTFSAQASDDIEQFVLEHGTTSLALQATLSEDGLDHNQVSAHSNSNGVAIEIFHSYAETAMLSYQQTLELFKEIASSDTIKKFVGQTYPVLANAFSQARMGYRETDLVTGNVQVIVPDTTVQKNVLLFSLDALQYHSSPQDFVRDIYEYVPDTLDQLRKNGDTGACADLAMQAMKYFKKDLKEHKAGFINTVCTREVADLLKQDSIKSAVYLFDAMKRELEVPQKYALILTDPRQEEKKNPLALMVGVKREVLEEMYDQDFMITFESNKKLLIKDNLKTDTPFYDTAEHVDTVTSFRINGMMDTVEKIPMYLKLDYTDKIGNHLHLYEWDDFTPRLGRHNP